MNWPQVNMCPPHPEPPSGLPPHPNPLGSPRELLWVSSVHLTVLATYFPYGNICFRASLVSQTVKNLPAIGETWVQFLDQVDPLEKGMATHSSGLAWRIPGTEEPHGLQSMEWQRVGHAWAINQRRQWQPTPVFLPGESQGRGSLVGCSLWGRTE